nr:MAG TPA: hypothetical protein [Caudoviricetes sp.]
MTLINFTTPGPEQGLFKKILHENFEAAAPTLAL